MELAKTFFSTDIRYTEQFSSEKEINNIDRKYRLFICACCRRAWNRLTSADRSAVEIGERIADEKISMQEVIEELFFPDHVGGITRAASRWALIINEDELAKSILDFVPVILQVLTSTDTEFLVASRSEIEHRAVAHLFFDLFRNRFPHPIYIDPAWQHPTHPVRKLTETIYESRSFEDLPILADALEEAGCEDDVLLRHCRVDSVHARGCWVLDLLLDRE